MPAVGIIAQDVGEVYPMIDTSNTQFVRGDGSWVNYTQTNLPTRRVIYTSTPTGGNSIVQQIYTTTTNSVIILPQWTDAAGTQFISNISTGTSLTYYTNGPQVWEPYSNEEVRQHNNKLERTRSANVHRAKSAIKKALKLIDNIGFGDDVRIFLGGDEITISHPHSIFKFVLSKRSNSIVQRTISPGFSTPYKLQLFTKCDVHVADLCVYLPDTPVLDQILAVAMYIKTGSEEDILEKANWFNKTKDPELMEILANEDPLYARKLGMRVPAEESGTFFYDTIPSSLIVSNNWRERDAVVA